MTVAVNESDKRFHGSGSTGPFTWTWRFLANADIQVYRVAVPDETNPLREERVLLVEGVDYALTGAGTYQGGSLTLTDALANGTDLYVRRNTAALQAISIRNQGNNFRPEVHEEVFDRLTMIIQDREARIADIEARGYTVTLQQSEAGTVATTAIDTSLGNVEVELPAAGIVRLLKDGEANLVSWVTTVEGQTVDPWDSLSGDGEFIQLELIGTKWRRTG